MVRQRYDLREWSNAGDSDRQAGAARDRLNEAVKELRRLTEEDQLFQAVERLSDVEDICGAGHALVSRAFAGSGYGAAGTCILRLNSRLPPAAVG